MNGFENRPIRVLIADDSSFFQQRIESIVKSHPKMEVVALASNGKEALDKTRLYKPDVITMDYEMPEMDGLAAVKAIMEACPTPILMFSSLTYNGARVTLDALTAGAVDFLPKNFAEVSRGAQAVVSQLHEKILQLSTPRVAESALSLKAKPERSSKNHPNHNDVFSAQLSRSAVVLHSKDLKNKACEENLGAAEVKVKKRTTAPKVILLGASTGGPVAVADILKALPRDFSVPIVVIQHMPEQFTKAFAERLNRQCDIRVIEGQDGDQLLPGQAILAPGGKQLAFNPRQPKMVKVMAGDEQMSYRPALDITFASAAKIYGDKALAVVLTGMGSDGCLGGKLLYQQGSKLWAQDENSSVIYGMPKAVVQAGVVDRVLPLSAIAEKLQQFCSK